MNQGKKLNNEKVFVKFETVELTNEELRTIEGGYALGDVVEPTIKVGGGSPPR
jgi:bacteriocin-like protein